MFTNTTRQTKKQARADAALQAAVVANYITPNPNSPPVETAFDRARLTTRTELNPIPVYQGEPVPTQEAPSQEPTQAAPEEAAQEQTAPEALPEPSAPAPAPSAPATAQTKPRIRDRVVPASERVKPIRRNTKQAHVLKLMDTGTEITQIVELVGVSLREVKHHILNLQAIGVGNEVQGGKVKALYPEGYDFEKCFVAGSVPAPKQEPAPLDQSLVDAGY
jgi:hypothetical protein